MRLTNKLNAHTRRAFAMMALCMFSILAVLPSKANAAQTSYKRYSSTGPAGVQFFTSASAACSYYVSGFVGYTGSVSGEEPFLNCVVAPPDLNKNKGIAASTIQCTDPQVPNSSGVCAAPADNTCAGYASPELAIANSWANLSNPVCTRDPVDRTQITCTGTNSKGVATSVPYSCGGTHSTGVTPAPIPSPPPPVEVSWPDCPAGTYGYIDVQSGTSSCSTPEPQDKPDDPNDCASGNAGTVNGKFVCLPSNPAPAVAQAAADSAQAKANDAKAQPGTQAAQDAAKQASIDAQRAVDAANSKPDDAAAQANAKRAIEAARQASGHAGVPYNGPAGTGAGAGTGNGTGGSGTGTGGNGNSDTGPRECGTPGRPKCQIDETGTPTNGDASMKVGKDALDAAVTAHTQALNQVTSGDGKDTSWGWFPAVPHSTCSPIQFANLGTLDWCATAPAIEEVMSWLWSLTAVIFVIAMTSSTIKGN